MSATCALVVLERMSRLLKIGETHPPLSRCSCEELAIRIHRPRMEQTRDL
jgi:hypothetical protein